MNLFSLNDFAHDMPRIHGYVHKGERCYGRHEWKAKGRTNVIGALLDKLLLTVCLFDCYVNANVFHTWVTKDLIPKLPLDAVVVMDNATFHKRLDIQKAFEQAGFIL